MSTLADVFSTSLGAALTLAISVEGGVSMVLFAPMIIRKFREEGRREGRREANAAWEAWNKRRQEAEANNQPFTEPPPSQDFLNGKA